MIQVEICTPGRSSAVNAQKGGACRVELCANLAVGGVTPSFDDIEYCVTNRHLRTHVLIRPRGGDFCYSDSEFQTILNDIRRCREIGAHAVVVGFLNADRTVDTLRTRRAVEAADGMEVTFHRAFDEVEAPLRALEDIISCGCHRILTSGCRPTAEEGIPLLRQLVLQSAGRISILAGSGITPQNVRRIIAETGVTEVHGSCKHTLPDGTIETDSIITQQLISQTL